MLKALEIYIIKKMMYGCLCHSYLFILSLTKLIFTHQYGHEKTTCYVPFHVHVHDIYVM
jgi:hypothetical protein